MNNLPKKTLYEIQDYFFLGYSVRYIANKFNISIPKASRLRRKLFVDCGGIKTFKDIWIELNELIKSYNLRNPEDQIKPLDIESYNEFNIEKRMIRNECKMDEQLNLLIKEMEKKNGSDRTE